MIFSLGRSLGRIGIAAPQRLPSNGGTYPHLNVQERREGFHQVHHVPLFPFILNICATKVQLGQTIVQVFAHFFDANNRVYKDRLDGCLSVYRSIQVLIKELLLIIARKEPKAMRFDCRDRVSHLDEVFFFLARIPSQTHFELGQNIDQNLGRILLEA